MVEAFGKETEKNVTGTALANLKSKDTNTEVFVLDEGQATLQLPAKLSPESYEDLKSWLELIMKKAKRTADKYSDDLV